MATKPAFCHIVRFDLRLDILLGQSLAKRYCNICKPGNFPTGNVISPLIMQLLPTRKCAFSKILLRTNLSCLHLVLSIVLYMFQVSSCFFSALFVISVFNLFLKAVNCTTLRACENPHHTFNCINFSQVKFI